jgi:AraC-like DNA-binding protein
LRDAVESGRERPEDSLEALVAACLDLARRASRTIVLPARHSCVVRQAEEFFRHHLSDGVSMARLSVETGVSERSLRIAFNDVYATSPKRYLMLWQLHQVRRALQSGSATTTVTGVATEHGFFELGRFAAAYRSLFGERPSETLNARAFTPSGSSRS